MLLDLGLPDASGIDVLREIRGSGERFDPELPVLVLSGRTSEADRLRGFEAGADDYLVKPFHYPELLGPLSCFRFQVLQRFFGRRKLAGSRTSPDLCLERAETSETSALSESQTFTSRARWAPAR